MKEVAVKTYAKVQCKREIKTGHTETIVLLLLHALSITRNISKLSSRAKQTVARWQPAETEKGSSYRELRTNDRK